MRIQRMSEVSHLYQNKGSKVSNVNKKVKEDGLELSSQAVEYTKARQLIKEVPDIRMDKIKELQQQISAKTYSVDAKEVASRMVSQFDMRG